MARDGGGLERIPGGGKGRRAGRKGSQRAPQPDPARRPVPGLAGLRDRLLSGFDSPEGSVDAGAGTIYQDVNPQGTGDILHKTTPDGNTGWQSLGGGAAGPFVVAQYAASPAHVANQLLWNTTLAGDSGLIGGTIYTDAVLHAPEAGLWELTLNIMVHTDGSLGITYTCTAEANGSPLDRQYVLDYLVETPDVHVTNATVYYDLAAGEYVTATCGTNSAACVFAQTTSEFAPPQPPLAIWRKVA